MVLHGETDNLGDITKITELPKADMWTYSFPCTDISVAGKMEGLAKGSGTRSGLLWEVERLLLKAEDQNRMPKYLLLENVKNLVGKNFKADYEKWLAFLSGLGYKNYWEVLNAKNFGIPQNRERVFCVSILGDEKYEFPKPKPLTIRLKDLLEEKVEEKYYITNAKAISMLNSSYISRRKSIIKEESITPTLAARDYKEPKCVVIGELSDEKYKKMIDSSRRVYDAEGLSPTIHTCNGGNTEPKIIYDDYNSRISKDQDTIGALTRNIGCSANRNGYKIIEPVIVAMRGRNPENPTSRKAGLPTEQMLEINDKGVSNALTTVKKDNLVLEENHRFHKQAIETMENNDCSEGDTIDAFNKKVNKSGVCPTLTSRPDGFKTAILPIVCEQRYDEGLRVFKDNVCGALRSIDAGGAKRVMTLKENENKTTQTISEESIDNKNLGNVFKEIGDSIRIRKLTPRECLRLMGWKDKEIDKIVEAGISSTQIYRQAGNGIVVNVLEEIFKKMPFELI